MVTFLSQEKSLAPQGETLSSGCLACWENDCSACGGRFRAPARVTLPAAAKSPKRRSGLLPQDPAPVLPQACADLVGAGLTIRGGFVSACAPFAVILRFRVLFHRASAGVSLHRGASCGGAESYDNRRVSDSGRGCTRYRQYCAEQIFHARTIERWRIFKEGTP